MKKLLLCLLLECLLKNASAQLNDFAWIQNQYHNSVLDFAIHETHIWVVKPGYVIMLDTANGDMQVFNDFIFPENAHFGSSTIFNSILADDSGHVYVNYYGIENGIYKYDGQTWTKYPCSEFADSYTLGTMLVRSSQQHFFMAKEKTVGEFDGLNWQTYSYTESFHYGVMDSHDTLWLTTFSGKLISFNAGTFKVRLTSGASWGIAIDGADNLFIPYSVQYVVKFHSIITDTIPGPGNYFSPFLITATSNNNLYLAGLVNSYYHFNGSNWTELNSGIPGNFLYPSAIGTDDQQHVWFGSDNGFLAKQENDFTSTIYEVNYSGLPDKGNYAVSAFNFNNNNYGKGLSGTQNGLFDVDLMTYEVTKIDTGFESVLIDKRINCIEKFGNNFSISIDTIWIGTNEGLFGMDKDYNWVQFTKTNSPLPNDTINYILYDNDKIWIATNGGAACYHFNGTWQTYTSLNSPLPADHVYAISGDNPPIIFCTSNGVAYFNDPDWKILNTFNSGLIDNNVKTVYTGSYGHCYFGTVAHGICDSITNGNWNYFNTSTGLSSDSIIFITGTYGYGDPIMAGTRGGGILSFQYGSYLYNTTSIEGIELSDVTDHTLISDGQYIKVLISTDKGILYKDFGGSAPVNASQSSDVSAYFSSENLVINYELK
ncbi:MAG TPA: hypothetical protein PLD84_09530, partial [Chitinophagales bacterium]|nr:hypothetical protein [Chitinophagales bacterium]